VKASIRTVTAARSGADPSRGGEPRHKGSPWFLALTAIGVVFGDIGTSPLYTLPVTLGSVCRQSISDIWLGNLRECLAHLV